MLAPNPKFLGLLPALLFSGAQATALIAPTLPVVQLPHPTRQPGYREGCKTCNRK